MSETPVEAKEKDFSSRKLWDDGGLLIGTFLGAPIRMHWSWFLFIVPKALGALGLHSIGPLTQREHIQGLVFILTAFLCVLLHEMGHLYAAFREKVTYRAIYLHFFGGAALIKDSPSPRKEFIVTFWGPMVNVGIILLGLLWMGLGLPDFHVFGDKFSYVTTLVAINAFMLVFNLIPAYPMDGGRMLYSIAAMRYGERTATVWSVRAAYLSCIFFVFLAFALKAYLMLVIVVFIWMENFVRSIKLREQESQTSERAS